ncbi:hypothetical protein BDV93DRAFT_554545 [Ceratobasidium sp. AG-I]|nr:hypothetical protein BDV93DRAFT_554545 [Ceratobasidium sp. AG-I]
MNPGGPFLIHPKWAKDGPSKHGSGFIYLLLFCRVPKLHGNRRERRFEDLDMAQFFTEVNNEEEAMWNEVHASSTPNVQHCSRHPTPLGSTQPRTTYLPQTSPAAFAPPRPHLFSIQDPSRARTPLTAPMGTFVPVPNEVPADLRSMSILELQRLLLSNYKQLANAALSAIDDPDQDRLFFDAIRGFMSTRIPDI